jgi:hypothetical protein
VQRHVDPRGEAAGRRDAAAVDEAQAAAQLDVRELLRETVEDVVAATPFSSPARASWNAPVQTDIVTSVPALAAASQARDSSVERCAGTTMTWGCGAFRMP